MYVSFFLSTANSGEEPVFELLLQALHASADGTAHGPDCRDQDQQGYICRTSPLLISVCFLSPCFLCLSILFTFIRASYKLFPAIFSSKYSLPIPSSISSCLAPWFVYAQMFPLPLPLPLPSLLPLFLFLSPCLPAQTRLRIQLCSPTFWTYSPCVLQDTPTLLGITSSTRMPSQGFSSSWPPLMHTLHLVCSIMTVVLVN